MDKIWAIMIQLLSRHVNEPYGEEEPRIRMHATTFASEEECEAEYNTLRRQNLPFKKMWIVSFEDPRNA